MKLTEMREMLAKREIQLDANRSARIFCTTQNQLRRIVDAAELSNADKVLEIGPGLGPLTELLLEKAGEVLAIEKDARLVDFLCERFDETKRFAALENRTTPAKAAFHCCTTTRWNF